MKLVSIAAMSTALAIVAVPALAGGSKHNRVYSTTDAYIVERDDRGAQKCYQGTYYPAQYKVYPKGRKLRGAQKSVRVNGDLYVVSRDAPLYVETRKRIKEDYVSLRRVAC